MRTTTRKSKPAIKAVKVDGNKRVIPSGSSTKPRYWLVNVGKKVTGTRKQRRFFDTEREANEFIQSLNETKALRGTSAFKIDDKLAHEAIKLNKELEPFKVDLTHAVQFYLKHAPKLGNVRVNELTPHYLRRKENAALLTKDVEAVICGYTGNKITSALASMPFDAPRLVEVLGEDAATSLICAIQNLVTKHVQKRRVDLESMCGLSKTPKLTIQSCSFHLNPMAMFVQTVAV